jgi:hypothetical protein
MIELRQHIGKHVITGEPVHNPQYMIYSHGRHVGFLGFEPGSRPMLFVRIGPIEQRDMHQEIQRMVGDDFELGSVAVPPEPPKVFDDDDSDPLAAFE